MLPDSKDTVLGSSDQEVSPSGKNASEWCGVDISEVTGCHLLQQMSSQ